MKDFILFLFAGIIFGTAIVLLGLKFGLIT